MNTDSPLAEATDRGERLLRRLRLRHLQLLFLLGEGSTLRHAAARMNITEPAASKMIRDVEAACEATLFDRSPRGMQPNAAGLALIGRARGVVNEIAAAGREQEAVAQGASMLLHIGAPPFIAAGPVATAVAALKRAMPRVLVSVREAGARSLLQSLAHRRLDCVVCGIDPEFSDSDTLIEFRTERLYPDRLCVITSRHHRLTRRRDLRWRDLTGARWVLPGMHTPLRRAFVDNYLAIGVLPPRPEIEAGSAAAVAGFVRADPDLVGLVRIDGGLSELERGGLSMLVVRPQIALSPVSILYHGNHGVSADALAGFVAELKKATAKR